MVDQLPRFNLETLRSEGTLVLHPVSEHRYSLIWLHGMGDNAFGYLDIFMDHDLQIVPTYCKVILPTAPLRKVTVNSGALTHAWYDMKSLNFKEEQKKPQSERYKNFD